MDGFHVSCQSGPLRPHAEVFQGKCFGVLFPALHHWAGEADLVAVYQLGACLAEPNPIAGRASFLGREAGVETRAAISSHVHSLPMSFYGVLEDKQGRGRGIENPTEKAFTIRATTFVRWIMELAQEHFIIIRPHLSKPDEYPPGGAR